MWSPANWFDRSSRPHAAGRQSGLYRKTTTTWSTLALLEMALTIVRPACWLADIGIAMVSGTDVAIETSDVVLMNSNFSNLPHALGLVKHRK